MPSGRRRQGCAWSVSALDKRRHLLQLCVAAFSNGYLYGLTRNRLFTGWSKRLCLPGLHCYSCPLATTACPLGSLQASLAARDLGSFFYVAGMLTLFGSVLGRFVCGWLCPFGLLQELLHKIPFGPKLRRLPGERALRATKFVFLGFLCVLLPLFALDAFGFGKDWFCAYVCPAGTLEGGLLYAVWNEGLRPMLSWLFAWKLFLLVALLLICLVVYRPFCRYFCPLGALYGMGNHLSPIRLRWDERKCTHCGRCHVACPMDLDPARSGQMSLCIRCGKCAAACPEGALSLTTRRCSAGSKVPAQGAASTDA